MKDVNYPLRKAYFAALSTITYAGVPVAVYYHFLPSDIAPDVYIVFNSISSSDISTKNSFDTSTSIQVKIHSHKEKYNDGKAVDVIADAILQKIYTKPSSLDAAGIQIYQTTLQNDSIQSWDIQGNRVYVDRTLIFSHKIHQQ